LGEYKFNLWVLGGTQSEGPLSTTIILGGFMSFADDFAQLLQTSGVSIDPGAVPPPETIQAGLDSLEAWLGSLDSTTSPAVDEVTAEFPIKFGLSKSEVGIAPGLDGIMAAFDAMPASISASAVLANCKDALQKAIASQPQV
jgi:hypothetical protein